MGIVAPTDDSRAKGLIALSNAADGTFVQLWADPVTHRLLVDNVGEGDGTVTSVSVISANGLAGTVATATTTPAITLSTTVTGVLIGNGTSISAATTTGSGSVVLATAPTITGATLTTTSINGVTLTTGGGTTTFLNANGAYSTPSASAASVTVGTTTVLSGTSTRVLYDNAGVLGEYIITGSGNVVMSTSPTISSPTVGTQASTDNSTLAASTAYVTTAISNAIAGVNPAIAVQVATTAAGDTSALTYNNGVSGIGATLTGTINTPITIDGVLLNTVGQRLLVKNDTQTPSGAFNGVYALTIASSAGTAPVFTRALDYDTPSDINNTGAIPVVSGTANALTSWLLTSSVVTVGTSPLTYTQFSRSPISVLPPNLGGTGIANNASSTLTISGSFGTTLTVSGTTALTLPTSGTVTAQGNTVTGSGSIVLATSPTLVTPTLGVATATSLNGNTFTTGTYTLTGTAAKTLNFTNTLTLSGTDSTTMTFPATSATVAGLGTTQTFTGQDKFNNIIDVNNAITVTTNAGTVPVTFRLNTFTNSSAATMAITMATASAIDGQMTIVRIYDFSAVAQTIGWTNTENSTVSVPTTSNGSTTLPLTVGFMYNTQTSKWRCIASA